MSRGCAEGLRWACLCLGILLICGTIHMLLFLPQGQACPPHWVPYRWSGLCFLHQRIGRLVLWMLLIFGFLIFCVAKLLEPGMRRTMLFWGTVTFLMRDFLNLKEKAKKENWGAAEKEERFADFHAQAAPKVYDMVIKLQGLYIKIGQLASTIGAAVIPEAYIKALEPLQAGVPPKPFKEISRVFEQDMGRAIQDVFESFEEKPIGAASIAQAHVAILRSDFTISGKNEDFKHDRRVIVKVQYPEVSELMDVDIANILTLVGKVAPEQHEDLSKMLRGHLDELDFQMEAEHMQDVGTAMEQAGFAPSRVVVPKGVPGLASRNVLAMSFIEGALLQAIVKNPGGLASDGTMHGGQGERRMSGDAAIDGMTVSLTRRRSLGTSEEGTQRKFGNPPVPLHPKFDFMQLLTTLMEVHGHQVLLSGVANIDPHPGNVLVLPDGRLGLIDYGHSAHFSPTERRGLARVIVGLHEGNQAMVATAYQELGYQVQDPEPAVVFRYAKLHLDCFDFTPVMLNSGKILRFDEMLLKHQEIRQPTCIMNVQRLAQLLIGTGKLIGQAPRLSSIWVGSARQALAELPDTAAPESKNQHENQQVPILAAGSHVPSPSYGATMQTVNVVANP